MSYEANRVIVIGTLDTMLQRNKPVAVAERRTPIGGRVSQCSLQLDTPFGEPFRMTVMTGVQTVGAELLTEERVGQPIVVEGFFQTRMVTDPRYAVDENDRGRTTRELHLRAMLLREVQEGEPVGTSAVWLEGVVLTEPRFGVHRTAVAIELARTILRVRWGRPSGYLGSQALIYEEADINVSVPTTTENAEYLLRPGNWLRLVGQIDCVLIPLRGQHVEARLAQIAQEWSRQTTGETPEARRAALTTYRRQRERLSFTPLLTIVPAEITPLDGAQPGDLEEARNRERARRTRISEQHAAQQIGQPPGGAGEEVQEHPATPVMSAPLRPRRRTQPNQANGAESDEQIG